MQLREPRSREGGGLLPRPRRRRLVRGLLGRHRRPEDRRRRHRGAAALSPDADAARRSPPASTCWSRSRRSCAWTTTRRSSAARDRAGRVVLVGENDHYKPLAVQLRALLAGRRARRDGVRALHDDRAQAEGGRRLAQRRSDGGRRRVLRGRHSLAAPGRQPRPAHRRSARVSSAGVPGRARHARQEHDGRVPLRQRRRRLAVLLARDSVAVPRAAAVEAVRPRRVITFESNGSFVFVSGEGTAAAPVSGLSRHPRLPGDVSRFRPRDPRRAARRR